jgi:hypothetical protein
MTDKPLDQLVRLNDWLAEHEPDAYHTDADTATTIIGLLERLRIAEASFESCNRARRLAEDEVERLRSIEEKALEQSEYIQMHGLTEYEQARLRAEVERLRAALGAVEWIQDARVAAVKSVCAWCGMTPLDGHAPDCQRQRALGVTP